jgi:hypothetical protein
MDITETTALMYRDITEPYPIILEMTIGVLLEMLIPIQV